MKAQAILFFCRVASVQQFPSSVCWIQALLLRQSPFCSFLFVLFFANGGRILYHWRSTHVCSQPGECSFCLLLWVATSVLFRIVLAARADPSHIPIYHWPRVWALDLFCGIPFFQSNSSPHMNLEDYVPCLGVCHISSESEPTVKLLASWDLLSFGAVCNTSKSSRHTHVPKPIPCSPGSSKWLPIPGCEITNSKTSQTGTPKRSLWRSWLVYFCSKHVSGWGLDKAGKDRRAANRTVSLTVSLLDIEVSPQKARINQLAILRRINQSTRCVSPPE